MSRPGIRVSLIEDTPGPLPIAFALWHNEIRFGTRLASGGRPEGAAITLEDTVNARNSLLGLGLMLPLITAKPAQAQRVSADIIIGGGPVAGRVTIGDRPRPLRGVEWVRARDYRRDDWWRSFQRGSRIIVVYWDRNDDYYYMDRFRPDLLEIRLFERDGRYYRLEDDGYGFDGYDGYGYSYGNGYGGGYYGNGYGGGYGRGYVQPYVVPRYYPAPRYDQRPRQDYRDNRRYDNARRDGRWDNRGDARRDDRRDDRREGWDDHRDNRGGEVRGGGDNHRDNGRGNGRGRRP